MKQRIAKKKQQKTQPQGELLPWRGVFRDGWRISGHAIFRARQRWMETTDEAAIEAIIRVLNHGEEVIQTRNELDLLFNMGTRQVVVAGPHDVVTVNLQGQNRIQRMLVGINAPKYIAARENHQAKQKKETS